MLNRIATASTHGRNGDSYATSWGAPLANRAIAIELRSDTYAPPAPATAVPTLPLFGLLALGGLVGLFGLRKLRK